MRQGAHALVLILQHACSDVRSCVTGHNTVLPLPLALTPRQTKASPEVTVTLPPGVDLGGGPTLTGPAAVVLCQLLGTHVPDIQVGGRRSLERVPTSARVRTHNTHACVQIIDTTHASMHVHVHTHTHTQSHAHTAPLQDDTFTSSDPSVFRAASGDLAVSANVRTASGWLFPLPGALLFLGKPARFVRHEDVAGVEFDRVGTSSTFDMTLRLAGGGRLEFGQLEQGELPRVQAYVAERRLLVRRGLVAGAVWILAAVETSLFGRRLRKG